MRFINLRLTYLHVNFGSYATKGVRIVEGTPKIEERWAPTLGWRCGQGRSDGSIYPQNQSTLKICGCSYPVTQDRFDMIYVHVWDINIMF